MSQLKGYPSKKRDLNLAISDLYVTAEPIKTGQHALSVQSYMFQEVTGTDTVEAASTVQVLNLTSHSIKVGDIIRFTSGALSGTEVKVLSTDTNTVTLVEKLASDPSTSNIEILRHRSPVVSSSGAISVSSSPITFKLDGADQEVTEDSGTPSNNRPLPVKLLDVTGDINITANDLNVQLEHTGANPDSVQIGDGTETASINTSNELNTRDDDANTALAAIGVDTSSIDTKVATETTLSSINTKVATETTLAAILADTASLDLKDYATETTLAAILADTASLDAKDYATQTTLASILADTTSIAAEDFATQTTLAALLTELQLKADLTETQPVSASSLPLPTGASTETTSAAILTELQLKADLTETQPVSAASLPLPTGAATETTLASLLTELQLKADLTETQPVSAASLPLPTGASTETTTASILTELQLKADLTETQPVSAASLPLPAGASTETTLASILTELQGKADLAETQPVSAASLPLPSGAATEATLATIDSDTSALAATIQTEDSAHTGPDTGMLILGVRKDADTSPVSADGDFHTLIFDELGNLKTTATITGGAGDASAANQTTMIGHLSTIAGDTTSLDGKDFATQTTLASILTELQAKADLAETQPVSAASLPLPTGAATEATTATLATQTTAAAILTELQLKADLSETQPVSAASLPLPTGAATEATAATLATQTTAAAILTELQGKADLAETQPVSAASLPLPSGAATEATLATIDADTSTLAGAVAGTEMQVDIVSAGPIATETTLGSILTELQAKADLAETQPVSAASLPLPTGAATETSLATVAALSKNEDAIHASGDPGIQMLAVRKDAAGALSADGDYSALQVNSNGELKTSATLTPASVDVVDFARHDYSGGTVTTSAYTQLIASTAATASEIEIFDSSGQTLFLALGAAASEVDKLYIVPGGNGKISASIAASTRISVKAVSADADSGEIVINLIG